MIDGVLWIELQVFGSQRLHNLEERRLLYLLDTGRRYRRTGRVCDVIAASEIMRHKSHDGFLQITRTSNF
jgi:hypothetical protein